MPPNQTREESLHLILFETSGRPVKNAISDGCRTVVLKVDGLDWDRITWCSQVHQFTLDTLDSALQCAL